jgi:dolichol-phosphate mannosyltransferase
MKLLVVIPTYNEAENIENLLAAAFSYMPQDLSRGSVLVIDDNSPDGTAAIVNSLIDKHLRRLHLHTRAGKLGVASAYLHGFAWGVANGYDAILAMDADFSHNPKYIPAMLTQIETNDIVVGSRNVAGGAIENRSLLRDLITKGAALYCRLILHCPIRDFTGGFNMWSRAALEKIGIDTVFSRGYSFQIEMKYKAYRAHCKIAEIPIVFADRKYGKSKMSKKIFFQALLDVWKIKRSINVKC